MSTRKQIDTLLVANRGEIAVRVMKTARRLGIRTVAVFSEADADAPHVRAADLAVCIGPPAVRASYLDMAKIIDAAKKTGADAIHPGYGFLSENAEFAEQVAAAGLRFVGPPAQAIRLMGDKVIAKQRMIEAGVPTAPGYHGSVDDAAKLRVEAERIGYPVLVKASAGGGGRGMRIVRSADELAEAVQSASSEAANAFGRGDVFLEKLVVGARHVEIQVFCDTLGGAVHLGERECSVQRRHQKIIEEAPSPAVDAELRAKMGAAAVAAAKAIGYVGAGTVEFLLDDDRSYYFLEMNTRLQVEHPVTELITGFDLVQWQLAVAEGGPLPRTQEAIHFGGHAIETRLCAEDPYAGFLPQSGPILHWRPVATAQTRIDAGIREGGEVGSHYDPMIAKVIGFGQTREEATRAVRAALRDNPLLGVGTNRGYLLELLGSEAFARAEIKTDTLDRRMREDPPARPQPRPLVWAVAALARSIDGGEGWRSSGVYAANVRLLYGETARELSVAATAPNRFTIAPLELTLVSHDDGVFVVEHDGVRERFTVALAGEEVHVDDAGVTFAFVEPALREQAEAGPGGGTVRAPMGGRVVSVAVAVGDRVTRGQTLAIIEAMKIEHRVTATCDGIVERVAIAAGGQVAARDVVVAITPDPS